MKLKLVLTVIIFFMFNTNAFAYIDPGIGSIILQGLIGAIAAFSIAVKIYWQKIKDLFKNKNKNKKI
jgi:hypothetical protein